MNTTIAYCGLDCHSCPIHLATLEEDLSVKKKMRNEIAEQLAIIYKTTPKPEQLSLPAVYAGAHHQILPLPIQKPMTLLVQDRL